MKKVVTALGLAIAAGLLPGGCSKATPGGGSPSPSGDRLLKKHRSPEFFCIIYNSLVLLP